MWMNGVPVCVEGKQVAEVLRSRTLGFIIRNVRENGNIGVCFYDKEKERIREWLDNNYPGWLSQKPEDTCRP